jgi:YhcH/YjgK/YiaL family protein
MKKYLLILILLITVTSISLHSQDKMNTWSEKKAKSWFKKKEYLGGLTATPHKKINTVKFATQYYLNKAYWDKAFAFLRNTDLQTLKVGRHVIDGDNVFAIVQEAPTKDYDKTAFESHLNYIDLQYVISGEEKMGRTSVESVKVDKLYNEKADIAYYTGDGDILTVQENGFLLFFPGEAHRPNITPGGNKVVKKIVIKIRNAPEESM